MNSKLMEGKSQPSTNFDVFVFHEKSRSPQLQELYDAKKEYFAAVVLWKAITSVTINCTLPSEESHTEHESASHKISAALAMRNFSSNEMKKPYILSLKGESVDSYFSQKQEKLGLPASKHGQLDQFSRLEIFPKSNAAGSNHFQQQVMNSLREYDELFKNSDGSGYCIFYRSFIEKIRNDIQFILDIKMRIAGNLDIITKQIHIYFSELLQVTSVLKKLAELLLQKLVCKSEIATYLELRSRTLSLKAKVLKSEILIATYSDEVVKGHAKISKTLNNKIENMQSKILCSEESLKAYEIMGNSYRALVNEYSEIKSKIEKEKWAIRELQSKNFK